MFKVGDFVVGKDKTGVPSPFVLYKIIENDPEGFITIEEVDAVYVPLNKGKRHELWSDWDLREADLETWKEESWEINHIKEAEEYLNSPFARKWLKEMRYTVKVDEYGHKALFLSILPGYEKISNESFQKLCNAICWVNFHDKLRMTMWIGGKVDWTLFYQRPDRVNGQETYFCGVVAEDNFSPEEWEKDHSDFSFEYIRY